MGQSTDAQICYGVSLDEDFEAPWYKEKYDYDIELWWIYKIKGYIDPVQIYNEAGNYINELPPSKEDEDKFYESRKRFLKDNPVPIDAVYHCSNEYQMWILAIPGTVISANRGCPTEFHPLQLAFTIKDYKKLMDFCKLIGVEATDENTGWWLSSWWG